MVVFTIVECNKFGRKSDQLRTFLLFEISYQLILSASAFTTKSVSLAETFFATTYFATHDYNLVMWHLFSSGKT